MARSPQRLLEKELAHLPPARQACLDPAEREILAQMIERVKRGHTAVDVEIEVKDRSRFPTTMRVLVVAPDWAGLVDTVAGLIHRRGYNIEYILGFVTAQSRLGIVVVEVQLQNPQQLEQALIDEVWFKDSLKSLAKGGTTIERLVSEGAFKLQVYSQVAMVLEQWLGDSDELKELLAPGGEVERFVLARSEAYLAERRPEDLAEQILTNFRFQKRLRAGASGPLVKVRNLRTQREHLTAITVAGFERDLSLDDVLDALGNYHPGFQRKYDKQFTTPDGITVIRLEVTKTGEKPFPEEELPHLQRFIEDWVRRKRKREFVVKSGAELIGRAIAPQLAYEAKRTGIPQMYLHPEKVIGGIAEFRLVIVTPFTPSEPKATIRDALISTLPELKGIQVVNFKTTQIAECEVNLLTLQADLTEFESEEEVYEIIRETTRRLLGTVRDFDEGMRRQDRSKLKEVMELLREEEIEQRFIRELFYDLDDFFRFSTTAQQLANLIRRAHELVTDFIRSGAQEVKGEIYPLNGYTGMMLVGPRERLHFAQIHRAVEPLSPLITYFEIPAAVLVVLLIRAKRGTAKQAALEEKLKELLSLAQTPQKEVQA